MGKYLLAHDIGTSGNKASLFSIDGKLIKSTVAGYPVNYGYGGCAEQNPLDWWAAVCRSTQEIINDIDPKDVAAVSFSAQMQCCLVVDKKGTILRPAIIWADHRAEAQAKRLQESVDDTYSYQLLGHRISPSYSIEKLMWIKDNEPDIYKHTYKMLQVKDYIIYRMTGKFVTDYSDASGTNALDLENLKWSEEILSLAGIDPDKLPELHFSTDIIGTLNPDAAIELGLTPNTKVVCGGGDGPCSALGAGCIHNNEMFLTFGTSAWIGGTTEKKFLDKDQILFCFAHVIPGKYMPCGTMQSAGSSYSYMRNTFCQDIIQKAQAEGISSWNIMNTLAKNSPAGAKGLLFLPYLTGERSPRWNPDASASFVGIRMYHKREDYIRAALEGVAMNLDLILDSYRKYMHIHKMILTGGGAKGDIVAHILSDILETELIRPSHVEEATSIAAAVIAGVGCGIYKDFNAINRFLQFEDPILPDLKNAPMYHEQKKQFDSVYQALKPLYKNL